MTDRWVVRAVVVFLGLITLTIVVGGIWLTFEDHQLPDSLIAIGGGALGGLTAFLVSSRSSAADTPTPVIEAPATVVSAD